MYSSNKYVFYMLRGTPLYVYVTDVLLKKSGTGKLNGCKDNFKYLTIKGAQSALEPC